MAIRRNATVRTLDDLPNPFYIAHRGNGNTFPEDTFEAYRAVFDISGGNCPIELDVHRLLDGGLGIMHDSTVDRTTTATGNVSAFTTAAYQALTVDTGSWFLSGNPYGNLKPPLVTDIMRDFGGHTVIVAEVKASSAAQPMADIIKRYGLQDSILPCSFANADLAPFRAIGSKTAIIDAAAATAASTHLTNGNSWAFVDKSSAPQSNVTAYINAGLKVGVYNILRQADRDVWAALGVHAFVSDDAIYMMGTASNAIHRSSSDPFASKIFWHGQLIGNVSRGAFVGADRWGFDGTASATNEFVLWGWMSPTSSSVLTLDTTMTFDTIQSATTWGAVFIGLTDAKYANQAGAWADGYIGRIQTDGTLKLHRVNADGSSVQIGSNTASAAITAGNSAVMRLTVTASQLKWERTDVAANITSTGADALAHRPTSGKGWYAHGGRSGTTQQVSFKASWS